MAQLHKTMPYLALLAIVPALISATPVASASLPCDEALAKIWGVYDATSFERIESQVDVLKLNASDAKVSNFVSFPNEDDGC